MRSSFIRRTPGAADTGTRSGLHGQTLLSMGLVDLDRLLGGGLPLGSLLLVLEDPHSQQHLNFMKYFMAEGVVIGQKVCWIASKLPKGGVGGFLPAEASSSQVDKDKNNGDGDDDESQAELRIAWQYRKYIQSQAASASASSTGLNGKGVQNKGASSSGTTRSNPRGAVEAGIGREWCHTFDITKCMGEEIPRSKGMTCHEISDLTEGRSSIQQSLDHAYNFIHQVQGHATAGVPVIRGPEGVGRLVVQSLGGPDWWLQTQDTQVMNQKGDEEAWQQQVVCYVLQLRQMLQDSRCSAMVTCPAGLLRPSILKMLQHNADAVLCLQPIYDDSEVFALLPEASSACALLNIAKLPSAGMLAPRRPDTTLYVVRNKRRRLAITAVDIDPDAETRQQQQTQQSPSAKTGSMDF